MHQNPCLLGQSLLRRAKVSSHRRSENWCQPFCTRSWQTTQPESYQEDKDWRSDQRKGHIFDCISGSGFLRKHRKHKRRYGNQKIRITISYWRVGAETSACAGVDFATSRLWPFGVHENAFPAQLEKASRTQKAARRSKRLGLCTWTLKLVNLESQYWTRNRLRVLPNANLRMVQGRARG